MLIYYPLVSFQSSINKCLLIWLLVVFALPLLPSMPPVSVKFCKQAYLVMSPRISTCFFLILCRNTQFRFLFLLKLHLRSHVPFIGFSAPFCRNTSSVTITRAFIFEGFIKKNICYFLYSFI